MKKLMTRIRGAAVAVLTLGLAINAQAEYVEVTDGFYQNAATYGAATEFRITNLNGFHFFRDLINQDNGATDDYVAKGFYGSTADQFYTENPFKNKTVQLLCDIDEGNVAVKPIGMTEHSRADGQDKRYFYGIFDGCNHTISNLRVVDDPATDKHRVGLFGVVARDASTDMAGVVNLTVNNAYVSGYSYVGGFIGGLSGAVTLTNCHLTGAVTLSGTKYTGGFIGHSGDGVDSQIVGCSVDVTSGSTNTSDQAGGIAGYMGGGDIIGCTVRGLTITAKSSRVLGGIAGKFAATGCVAASNTVDSVTIIAKTAGASGSVIGSFGAAGQTLIDNTVVNTHVYDPDNVEVFGQCHFFASGDTTTIIGWNSVGTLTDGGITGGTFERLPATYLASGYEAVAQGTTPETYVVQKAVTYVARVGDTEYETLAAAVAAAKKDSIDTITLLADCAIDSEVIVGTNTAATCIKTIEGTNAVSGGYYTITVKEGGKLVWDYANTTYAITLNANLVDQTTSGNGLWIRGRNSSYYPTIAGSVTAGGSEKFAYAKFLGDVSVPSIPSTSVFSACSFYGKLTTGAISVFVTCYDSVTADTISAGKYMASTTLTVNDSISGGTFYNMDQLEYLTGKLADGYVMLYNNAAAGAYVTAAPTSKIGAKALHTDGTITYFEDISYALPACEANDVLTLVRTTILPITVPDTVTLVVPTDVAYAANKVKPCDGQHKIVATEDDDGVSYVNVALGADDASAYLVHNDVTNYYNGANSAITAGQDGDKIYLNADSSETIEIKQGVTLYSNGWNITGTIKGAVKDLIVDADTESGSYSSRLRTASDSDVVASVEYTSDGQLHYFASLSDAVSCLSSGTTATLLKDVSIGDSDYTGSYMCGNLTSGKTIDGQGHTLTYTGSKETRFMSSIYGTITNMTFAGMRNALVQTANNGATFDTVKISGSMNMGNNSGAFADKVVNTTGAVSVTFRNCEMAMKSITQGGESNYNAAFIGTGNTSTITFENCKVTGCVITGKAGMFLANCNYGSSITLKIKDTYNEGLIQAVVPRGTNGYNYNPFMGYAEDGKLGLLTVKLTVDDVEQTYSGVDSLTNAAMFAALRRNDGKFLNGPTDATLALQLNDQGGFVATTATSEEVVKYVISSGLYADLMLGATSHGTSFFSVTETITNDQHNVKILPELMNYRFVDATWVAANPSAVMGSCCGNVTYTLNDETFYYIDEGNDPYYKRMKDGQPVTATNYSISAYDADDNLLFSALLAADTYTLTAGVFNDVNKVTYLYDTLQAAFDAVQEDETIEVLANNSETITVTNTCTFKFNSNGYTLSDTAPICADGYEFVQRDNICTYQHMKVAQVVSADGATTNAYKTLQAAFNAVQAGETIEVLFDNDEEIIVKNAVPFTLKANGHTLSTTAPAVPDGWKFVQADDVCVLGEIVPTSEETTAVVIIDKQSASVDPDEAAKVISDDEVVEKIEQNTTVTGVKLVSSNETHVVSGAQSVVAAAKESGSDTFKTNLEKGTNVIIQVDVEVKPTAYAAPTSETTEGMIKFNLTPIATVTIDEGGENKTNTVAVTNEMIDQLQDIAVTVYTGFKPIQAVHTDTAGNTIQVFETSEIEYDEVTGNATIIIHHFSDVVFYEEAKVANYVTVENCKDDNGDSVSVQINWTWLNDYCVTEENATDTSYVAANGLPIWKSYVLGLNPNEEVAAGNLEVLPQADGTVDVTFYGVTDAVKTDLVTATFSFYYDDEVDGTYTETLSQNNNALFEDVGGSGTQRFYRNARIHFTWVK